MVRLAADAEDLTIDQRISCLNVALHEVSATHFGTKLTGGLSKAWFDPQVRVMFQAKWQARRLLTAARQQGDPVLLVEAEHLFDKAKRGCKSLVRSKKTAQDRKEYRSIERVHGQSAAFWSRWKARVGDMDKDPFSSSVADIKDNIVTDPLLVLDTWKKYCEKLGCDGGGSADQGDRAQSPEAQRDSERVTFDFG
jgi:hypothetical protein